MGFWGKLFGTELPGENEIKRVVLINQTVLFQNKISHGLSFGGRRGDGRVFLMEETGPVGKEFTFSVTYNDGREKIIKAMNGTQRCDKLLKLAYDKEAIENKRQAKMSLLFLRKKNKKNRAYTMKDRLLKKCLCLQQVLILSTKIFLSGSLIFMQYPAAARGNTKEMEKPLHGSI